MADLTVDINHDLSTDVTVVVLHGVLDLGTTPRVRDALSKSLAQCPSAVIVDLRVVKIAAALALTVLYAARQPRSRLPDVPVLVCIDAQALARTALSRTALGPLTTFDSIDGAVRHVKEAAQSMSR